MPEDLLSLELQKALAPNKRNNYIVDVAGDLGATVRAPGLTNLLNTLTVSSHGGQLSGFSPDSTATNALANTLRQRIEDGGQLSLEDIARNMGSATNEIKRAIIDACFAAGYNFNTVKRLFPNLEQLVAPSTDKPTSAVYSEYLTGKEETWKPYNIRELSPFYSITPTSTNIVRKASDWLDPKSAKQIASPISEHQKYLKKEIGGSEEIQWSPTNYSSKPFRPSSQITKELDVLKERMKRRLAASTNSTEIDLIQKQWQDEIDQIFK